VRHVEVLRYYNGLLPSTELHLTPLGSSNGSTVAILGCPGPRFSHRHPLPLTLRRISDWIQRAPRSQVIVPGGRLPCLPRQRLQAAAAGRHASLRLQDVSGRRPSKSEAANLLLQPHFVVNRKTRIVAKKILGCSPSARRREIRGRRIAAFITCVTRGLDHASRIYPTCALNAPKLGKPDFGWSIALRKKLFAKEMDGRVKPGHDGLRRQPGLSEANSGADDPRVRLVHAQPSSLRPLPPYPNSA
jgi:hypothetical protein